MDRLYWVWIDEMEINYIISVLEERKIKYYEWKYIYIYI